MKAPDKLNCRGAFWLRFLFLDLFLRWLNDVVDDFQNPTTGCDYVSHLVMCKKKLEQNLVEKQVN